MKKIDPTAAALNLTSAADQIAYMIKMRDTGNAVTMSLANAQALLTTLREGMTALHRQTALKNFWFEAGHSPLTNLQFDSENFSCRGRRIYCDEVEETINDVLAALGSAGVMLPPAAYDKLHALHTRVKFSAETAGRDPDDRH